MIFNTFKAYLFHSVEIFKNEKLSLYVEENVEKYVPLTHIIKIFFESKMLAYRLVQL